MCDKITGFKIIPNWVDEDNTCITCGTKKSVKYILDNNKTMCNTCVLKRVAAGW